MELRRLTRKLIDSFLLRRLRGPFARKGSCGWASTISRAGEPGDSTLVVYEDGKPLPRPRGPAGAGRWAVTARVVTAPAVERPSSQALSSMMRRKSATSALSSTSGMQVSTIRTSPT